MDIPSSHHHMHQLGFTLIELLTTLSILLILLTVGLPSLQPVMANSKMTAAVNTMATHLNLARSEAVYRGIRTILCPSSDGTTCLNSTEWHQGFILFADNNANRIHEEEEKLLRIYTAVNQQQIHISTTNGRKWVRYQSTGAAPGSNLTMTFCDTRDHADPKALIISSTGRIRLSATKPSGAPLDC
ncbi:Type IV fimbrial biogenesis protein FimT [hydrothermal vent metagenome]|uniref:Type IV fimbrial biogenesis protein FimT n=1 Tax=hydrothermal vent metagenome TaxID=652676 RepID=A0A3B1ALV2_9ZZZZ